MKRCLLCENIFDGDMWTCSACGNSPEMQERWLCFSPEYAEENDGFDVREFRAYAELEWKNFWFVSRARLLIHFIKKFFPRTRDFLEVGCGTGFILSAAEKALPNATLSGSDIYLESLNFTDLRLQGKATLYQMEACAIPFRQAFDVVGAFDVLEHIDDDKKALKELCATVRSGGGLVLTVPQHAFLWSAWDGMNRHKRRYAVWELEKMVENEGFKILCSTSFASLLMPLFIARRMAERHKTEMSFADGARINPLVNLVCAAVMVLERGLIYSGLRLPFGGSSLVIARKPGELTA